MVLKCLFSNSLKNLFNSKIFKAKVIPKYYPANIYLLLLERSPMLVLT